MNAPGKPTSSPSTDEAPPIPPVCPSDDECCHSGCNPCVFDLYNEELQRYREELKRWQERTGR